MRGKMMIAGIAFVTLFSQLFISPATAAVPGDPVPPPDDVVIDSVTANGSGCPPGTAAAAVTPGGTAFTVTYSQHLARVGVGSTPTDFRKNCQLNVLVLVPPGYTYAISGVDHRGYAALAPGATAMQRASYYFQGSANTRIHTHTFAGPFDDNWQTSDQSDLAVIEYHPCGALRSLNINTELRVNAGTSDPTTTTSFIALDSADTYRFHWRLCP